MKIKKKIKQYYNSLEIPSAKKVLPNAALREKKPKTTYKYAFAAVVCLFLTFSITLPLMQSHEITPPLSQDPATEATSTESKSEYSSETEISEPETSFAPLPNPVYALLQTPYAIVNIHEITDETIFLSQGNDHRDTYVKVRCAVHYAYETERYSATNENDGSGISHPLPFDEITEIYVTAASINALKAYDTVLFQVTQMRMNGMNYYGPSNDDDGLAEYLPIVNGKVVFEFLEGAFYPLECINEFIGELREYWDRGGEKTAVDLAFPKNEFESGMTTEEAIKFFEACFAVSQCLANESENKDFIV